MKFAFLTPKVVIVAHDGQFHADDVFAVAALKILLGDSGDSNNSNNSESSRGLKSKVVEVIRSREAAVINSADFVVDVGGVHDPEKNRFDHHQVGSAGMRSNSISFAAFGLVWQKYGTQIAGSKEAAEIIDQRLVQAIDALDNGISISKEIIPNVRPFDISAVIGAMNPNWNESTEKRDETFLKAVELAAVILKREIISTQSGLDGEAFAIDAYRRADDKRLIILDQHYPFEKVFVKFPEPIFVIYPSENKWWLKAVRKNMNSFENRKDLPAAWAGKMGAELSVITGIPGSHFCHNKLFSAGAETKEAAVAMAGIALDNKGN